MKRREFITLVGSAAITSPFVARTQETSRAQRIGVLMAMATSDSVARARIAAFREGLENWIDGRNVEIVFRGEPPITSQLRNLAAELVSMKPDVLVGVATASVQALLSETRTIPIVFAVVSDPIGSGFVASFAKPGGNVTGFTNYEATLGAKWLEILRDLAPGLTQVVVLFNPKTTAGAGQYYLRAIEAAAQSIGIRLTLAPFTAESEIEPAIAAFAREPHGGLLALGDASTTASGVAIVAAAAQHRLPAVYRGRFYTEIGGLASYATELNEQVHNAASYVDRILKGAKPADLPVQAPTKFELVINLKTVKTLGLTIPESFLWRADEVIE